MTLTLCIIKNLYNILQWILLGRRHTLRRLLGREISSNIVTAGDVEADVAQNTSQEDGLKTTWIRKGLEHLQ